MFLKAIVALQSKQRGLTTVEYAVAGGILVAGIIAAFFFLGGETKGIVNGIGDCLAAGTC